MAAISIKIDNTKNSLPVKYVKLAFVNILYQYKQIGDSGHEQKRNVLYENKLLGANPGGTN